MMMLTWAQEETLREVVVHSVMRGDNATAREYATRLAIARDEHPTYAETIVALEAIDAR